MSWQEENLANNLVERAVGSLRNTPVPDGPSAEAIAATISAARNAADNPPRTVATRFRNVSWKYIALLGSGTVAAIIAIALSLLISGNESRALGQALKKLRSVQRISFLVEQRSPDPARPAMMTRVWLVEPDKSRTEWSGPQGKVVGIRNGNMLVQVDAARKTVIVGEFKPGQLGSERQALDELRSVVEKNASSLGEKIIEGVRAKGFEAVIKGRKIVLWANAENGNPLRIEYPVTEIPPPHGPYLKVLSDFKFDEPFDPKMFDLAVPPDYRVSNFNTPALLPMDHMLAILRYCSGRADGEFPSRIDDHGEAIRVRLKVPEKAEAMSPDEKELVEHLQGLEVFLKAAKPGRHFEYYPGAKLGDKDRVVFWCVDPPTPIFGKYIPLIPRADAETSAKVKPPDEKYLAVYGDLRIEKLNKPPSPSK
ncbi:MAG TPA: hypothetical protein VGJ16_06660 [Pirellulales bacterium]|jgi:outer membrane lipoprotein-sorting protein